MNSTKVELLSPAGDPQKLRVALHYGADAVYGGVSHFSLRIKAGREFDQTSFKEAVDYTHSFDKKIYVTVNGFPFNSQLKMLEEHLIQMAAMNPDAFIVSTVGVTKLCKKVAPNIPLHLSTQANVLNYLDAEVFYDMGISRVIAAREVSLKDLEGIKKHLPKLELEAFVHGSMCFAYSGRCLISSLQMGRVPNRGSCANDCRMPYAIYVENPETKVLMRVEEEGEEGSYIFNAKDLNLMPHIQEILDSGVIDSLKIEGRTKSVYYAAVATKAYRAAIDDYYKGKFDTALYEAELNTLKSRGFTDGYLINRPYEKFDEQNQMSAISDGDHQVAAFVEEDEGSFLCKDKIYPGDELELVVPLDAAVEEIDNEIGTIHKKDGGWQVCFKKIMTADGKELSSVHSGNTNHIQLPCKLPRYSFLRRRIV